MPSDAPIKPEPADLDRLMTRIALAGLSPLEAIVAAEVMLSAIRGDERPCWKELATKYHTDAPAISRAKKMLGLKLYESTEGLRVNLDPSVWFQMGPKGEAIDALARTIHETKKTRLSKSPSVHITSWQNEQIANLPNCQFVELANSEPTSAPNRNASAPARGIEFNSNSIQKLASLPENSREDPEESRIAAEVRAVAMEHWGVEVAVWAEENAPFYDPKAFKAALVIAARRQKKNIGSGGAPFDSPSGYIHAVAKGFETDGIPPGAFAPPKKLPGWAEPAWQPPKQVFTPEEEAERLEALAKLRALCGLDKPKPAPTLRIAQ